MIAAIIALFGAYWYLTKPEPEPKQPKPIINKMGQEVLLARWDKLVSLACTPVLGNPKAEWTMIEIGDFQCPQCGKVHGTVESLVAASHGHVKLYFLNWPLRMHNNSRRAATASLAAEKQGKFWAMYDQIYDNQKGIDDTKPKQADDSLLGDAQKAGLDIRQFKNDCPTQGLQIRLQAQEDIVNSILAQSTPTFLLRKGNDKTVYWFIGQGGQTATPMTPAYPGLKSLMADEPWAGGQLPPPPDVAPTPTAGPAPVSRGN